jgi:hypothetical protein
MVSVFVAIKPLDEFCIRGTEIVRTIVDDSHTSRPRSLPEFIENREVLQRQITSILPVLWTAAARCSFPLHSLLWTIDLNSKEHTGSRFGSRLPTPRRQQAAAFQECMKLSPRLTCQATTLHL